MTNARLQFVLPITILLLAGCTNTATTINDTATFTTMPGAVRKPITFDDTRRQLSLQYLKERYDLELSEPTITPKIVVLHWTVIPTMEETFAVFEPAQLPGKRQDVMTAGALNVSSHYLVDRDGTIYQLLPELTFARHVIGLNHSAFGIENVGNGTDLPLTEEQIESNVAIIRYLNNKYGLDYLIGHYEYTRFDGHPLWLEKDSGYRTEKIDPGERFMKRVRAMVSDLGLGGAPADSH